MKRQIIEMSIEDTLLCAMLCVQRGYLLQ